MNAKSFGAALALIGLGAVASAQGAEQTSQGPVRLARISSIEGDVTWRETDGSDWSRASVNIPIRQGAQLWANGNGKSEVQFDDGSVMRMGRGAVATMESFFSDKDGEFTEIKVNSGTVSFHTKNEYSVYQIDTPFASVKATGATRFRVDVDDTVSVSDRLGRVNVTDQAGDVELRAGDAVRVGNTDDKLRVEDMPREDSWDAYDDSREGIFASIPTEYCPTDVAIVAIDLGGSGHWRHHSHYGNVWYPNVGPGWQPYRDGNWIWCEPFGWTWCSNESWGWAPYHYGSWIHEGREWGWCPGPAHQYWSPGVVHFTSFNGDYAWAPLCPEEIRYPASFGIGFNHGNWWMNFSIGGCAAYCPVGAGYCDPFLFDFTLFFGGHRRDSGDRFGGDWRRFHDDHHFVPRNSAFGAVTADSGRFGQGGTFHSVNHDASGMWKHGQSVTASGHAFSGPTNARPSSSSWTPSHKFESARQPSSLDRPLYRSNVRSDVQKSSEPFGRTGQSGRSGRDLGRQSSDTSRGVGRSSSTSSDPADRVRRARESLGYTGRSGEDYGRRHSDSSGGVGSGQSSSGSERGGRGTDRTTQSSGSNDRRSGGSDRSTQTSGSSDRGSRGTDRSTQSSGGSDRGSRGPDRSSQSSGSSGRGFDRSSQSSGSSDRGSRGYDRSSQSSGSSDRGSRGADRSSQSSGSSGRGFDRSTQSSGSSDRESRGYDRSSQSSGSSDRGSRGPDRSSQSSGSSGRGFDRSTQSSGSSDRGSRGQDRSSQSSSGGGRSESGSRSSSGSNNSNNTNDHGNGGGRGR